MKFSEEKKVLLKIIDKIKAGKSLVSGKIHDQEIMIKTIRYDMFRN